ncbi:MAG: ABC transporter ATP-binding protein [Desulfonatronovibrionaceae bacterium]
MISLHKVDCGYKGRTVLKGVDLKIYRGEKAALLGPNGSGKTTLLQTVSGCLEPLAGSLWMGGREVPLMGYKERARQMAGVPQDMHVPFDIRVMSLVLMGRYPYTGILGGYSEEDRDRALAALEDTGSLELRSRSSQTLSGGELQRVLISRALAQEPDLLLLDEAASNLDVARKAEVFGLLRQEGSRDLSVLAAVHDLNLAALYFDRLIFLKGGRIVQDGPVDQVFNSRDLSRIFEVRVSVFIHPEAGVPQAFFVPDPCCGPGGISRGRGLCD